MFDQDMYSQNRQPYGYDMGNTMPQPMSGINTSQVPALYPSTLTPNLSSQSFMPNDQGGKPMYRRGGQVRRYAPGGAVMGGRGGIRQFANNGNGFNQFFQGMANRGRPQQQMPQQSFNRNGYNITNGLNQFYQGMANGSRGRQLPMASYQQRPSGLDQNNMVNGMQTGGYKPTPEEVEQMYPQHGMPQRFAEGGLAKYAERIREAGTDGDTILAHINPIEAAQLSEQSGGPSINPETGLPSYKFKIGKVLKTVARVAAPFVGGAIAGPAGAAVGGGLSGLIGGGKNKVRNTLIGAGLGYVGAGGLGELGGVGNIIPNVNNAVGLSGLAGKMGLGANTAVKAGTTIGAQAAAANAAKSGMNNKVGLSDLLGKDPIGNALLATTLIGGLGGIFGNKNKGVNGQDIGGAGSIQEGVNAGFVRPGNPDRPVKPTERVQRIMSEEELKALEAGGNPQWQYFENANPEVQYMAHGGYLDGHDGGQDDTIDAKLSDGEYVISADVVSNLGDGNNRKGAKKLDMLMKNSRAHKYAKGGKSLPPKSKSLEAYMQAKRRA